MKKNVIEFTRIPIRFGFPLALALLLGAALTSCSRTSATTTTRLSVGVPPLEQNALLYVASSAGYFRRHELSVTIDNFDSGPAAIAAMESGRVEVAETAEFPFVESIMSGAKLKILAANDQFENDYLVVRRDSGITSASDLRGKRVGVTLHTITQFYLGRFLMLNGVPSQRVSVVDVPPAQFVSSLLQGKVDALVAWQPYVSRIEEALPGKVAVWPVQSGQPVYGILVCPSPWLQAHEPAVESFLKALAGAQEYLAAHSRRSQQIVAARLGDSSSYVAGVWPDHQFALTLDYSLVAAMEGEARWMRASHLTLAVKVPDFQRLIYLKGLQSARPVGVNMME